MPLFSKHLFGNWLLFRGVCDSLLVQLLCKHINLIKATSCHKFFFHLLTSITDLQHQSFEPSRDKQTAYANMTCIFKLFRQDSLVLVVPSIHDFFGVETMNMTTKPYVCKNQLHAWTKIHPIKIHAMSIQVTDGQICHRHQQAFPASTRHSKKIKTQVQLENSCKTPIPPRLSNDVFNIRRCRLQWCLSCRWGSSRLTLDNQNKLKHAPIRKTKPINVQGTATSTWRSLRCPMWCRLLKKNNILTT